MLFAAPSPRDRVRYPAGYAAGLTPTIMGNLFDAADAGQLGPLNELTNEICGKEGLCKSLTEDRLSVVSDATIEVTPNAKDPSPGRASEATVFVEQLLSDLKLYEYQQHARDRVPVEIGELSEVQQAFASPWKHGTGVYFPVWATAPGEPRPKPVGVEYIDVARYRSRRSGSLYVNEGFLIETEANWQGEPLWMHDPLLWFTLSASQPGLPPSLMGAGRALVFPFYLNIGGMFTSSRLLEKYGVPNVIGEASYPEGPVTGAFTPEQRADLEAFLAAYQSDTTALFPKGFKANILNVGQGAHELARFVEEMSSKRLRLTITGNEVTGAASAPGAAGVAGGQGSVGERIQARITTQDRRRVVSGLRHMARRALKVWYGAECPCPDIKLVDPSLAQNKTDTTNTAPSLATQSSGVLS
jgi:phage gp29-like protein